MPHPSNPCRLPTLGLPGEVNVLRGYLAIGARIQMRAIKCRLAWSLIVRRDEAGQYFELCAGSLTEMGIVAVDARAKHLILFLGGALRDVRYLCGFDGRNWYAVELRRCGPIWRSIVELAPAPVFAPLPWYRRKPRKVTRHARWFFVSQEGVLGPTSGRQKQRLRLDHPDDYVVDQLFIRHAEYEDMDGPLDEWVVCVRGWLRHPVFRPILFRDWHRLFARASLGTGEGPLDRMLLWESVWSAPALAFGRRC